MNRWNVLALVVGLGMIVGLLVHTGVSEVVEIVRVVGFGIFGVAGVHGVTLTLETLAWRSLIVQHGEHRIPAARQPGGEREHLLLVAEVERVGRLVQQDDRAVLREHAGAHGPAMATQGLEQVEETFGAGHRAILGAAVPGNGSNFHPRTTA